MMAATEVPDEITGAKPFVMLAGETLATALYWGSKKRLSTNAAIAPAKLDRMNPSADGLEERASSAVSATIPATFAWPNARSSNAASPAGVGRDSPTQATVVLASVSRLTRMLNGTRLNP